MYVEAGRGGADHEGKEGVSNDRIVVCVRGRGSVDVFRGSFERLISEGVRWQISVKSIRDVEDSFLKLKMPSRLPWQESSSNCHPLAYLRQFQLLN